MTSYAREAGKYWAIFRIELRQLTTYTWDFILGNITIVLFFYILVQVWQVTVRPENVPALHGEQFTWARLIWFLAAGQVLYFAVQTEAQLDIERDVISGNIAVTLVRPYDYLLARFAIAMAHTVLAAAVAIPAAFAIAWMAAGTVAVTPFGAAAFALALVWRTLLFWMMQAIAGLATFWLEKATAFVWILGLLILIFGGGAVPIGFWPDWARTIAELTPFPTMMYYPARLLVQPSVELLVATAVRSTVWMVILGSIVWLLYRRALRRLDLNGG